ncbi:hypothetical protein [Actinomadura flavalba]|uniref:hypothetical protein n=1 Tax=Actinomadura flavalba TaxID=1120938 RepID=UPI00037FA0AF|nr:hypothetical protein [Actinomadura flavalba]
MVTSLRRRLAVLPFLALPLATVAACGGENASTSCDLNACTVTFQRGVQASASILGVKAELVGVQGNMVTLRIAGQQITVPRGGEGEAEGFNVAVQSVTAEQVVVRVDHGAGGGGDGGEEGEN